jgi:hypothetical protein
LPESVLDKYRIPYLFSLTDHLAALERARTVPHRVAVAVMVRFSRAAAP